MTQTSSASFGGFIAQDSAKGERPTVRIQILNLAAVVIPLFGLIAGIVLLWGPGFDWLHMGLFLGMYVLTALGITIGYHRLFTHRAFDARTPLKAVLGVLGSMAVEGPILRWAAQHRQHHQLSDREGDPHSPHLHGDGVRGLLLGLWHAHMGWMFLPDASNLPRYTKDLLADRLVVRLSKLFPVWVILGGIIPALVGGLVTWSWMGALLGLLWGGLARIFFVHHMTFSINSICHIWGTRPFQSHDESRNNPFFGVIGFGEGWHNNHHAFPASARHGLRWWEIDLSYYIIRGLAFVGLASNVRVPARETMAGRRRSGPSLARPT